MKIKSSKGFTLVEIAAVIFIFALLSLFAANMVIYSIGSFNRLSARQEVMENAWVALDFIAEQVKYADGYKISYRPGNTLRQLDLYTTLIPGAAEHNYVLYYNPSYYRMEFGGNELASGIKNVVVIIDDEKALMYITVFAESESGNEAVNLSTCLSLLYKEKR